MKEIQFDCLEASETTAQVSRNRSGNLYIHVHLHEGCLRRIIGLYFSQFKAGLSPFSCRTVTGSHNSFMLQIDPWMLVMMMMMTFGVLPKKFLC
jgi:hypothetical protein